MPLLQWLNDDEARAQANNVAYRLLEEQSELSYGDADTQNMLIQGDNLDALKALLPYYAGKVKCIYIDPPYNTKSAFESYDDNLEHSRWLEMMYPRLELLWELLSSDGVILVSINDDEGHYLKVICDEIFGRKNFVSSLIWHYEGNTDNQASIINYHEYIHLYSKSGKIEKVNVIDPNVKEGSKLTKDIIRNTIVKNGPKNPVKTVNIPKGFPTTFQSGVIEAKNVNWPQYNTNLTVDNYQLMKSVEASTGWSSKKILEEFIKNEYKPVFDSKGQETTFELTKKGAIEAVKKRKQEKGHFLSVLRGMGTTNQMRIQLKKLGLKFSYPKPVNLISYLVSAFTEENDIVLDSFSGSGTTAHAVLKVNKEDGLNRKFISIEMNENTTSNVIRPRLQAVIEGSKKANIQATDGGYRFYQLGETVFDEEGHINSNIKFRPLSAHVWFAENGKPLASTANSKTPFLGVEQDTAYFLLYNGILGDKKPQGGNVLTRAILKDLTELMAKRAPEFDGNWVVYGESCRIGQAKLEEHKISFKQTPYDIKAR